MLVPMLGALESAICGEAQLQAEAMSCGAIETVVALLRVTLKSEQQAPMASQYAVPTGREGRKYAVPSSREVELVPNLMLALEALVASNPAGVERFQAAEGPELLAALLGKHPMSESALLAVQILMAAGKRPLSWAKGQDSLAKATPQPVVNSLGAQVAAVLALDRFAHTLRPKESLVLSR